MNLEEAKAIIRNQADMGSLGHAAGLVLMRLEEVDDERHWKDGFSVGWRAHEAAVDAGLARRLDDDS